MSKPLVVENVVKRFGSGESAVTALDRISFTVEEGDFVAVMGASGSGKSTLLHLMAGLTHPDAGRVLVSGQDLAPLSDRRLTHFRREHIGLIFQTFNLIPTLTAAENIALPLRLAGEADAAIRQRVEAIVGKLGLSRRAHHRPDALSGGEQQRVAIGRALVTRPAVILADEPTGNLDSANAAAICRLLRQLNETDRVSIVLVTHEPSVALHARDAVFMRDGRLRHRLTIADVQDAADLANVYQTMLAEPAASPDAAAEAEHGSRP